MASLFKKLENLAQPASSWNYTTRGSNEVETDIQAHLVEILNTRMGSARTVPDYGLMEVSEVIHDFPDAIAMIQRSLKACIQTYEPRLKNVQVRHIKGEGFGNMLLLFAAIVSHILPNVLGPVIVYATLTVPAVMLLEAFLSFLGLGVQPPMSSWGSLIKDGAEKMEEYWWLLVFPGGVFSLTLFSLNFLGDGLRDALDVRAAKD